MNLSPSSPQPFQTRTVAAADNCGRRGLRLSTRRTQLDIPDRNCRIILTLLAGRVDDVVADLKPHRDRSDDVEACIRYYEANRDRMRYDLCRTRGLPVGSGSVDSACKQIVGNRFKGAVRHWSKTGANGLLAIRCCLENMRWPGFLEWRDCRTEAA